MRTDLKPYPAYKPSGIPWLGGVPEHWHVRRLRTLADMRVSNVDKHTKEDEFPVRLCNYVDVYKHDRITPAMPFMTATASRDEIERFRLERDDVLITKDSEAWDDIGVPALVTEAADDLLSGYHLALLRPFKEIVGAYLARTLQSKEVAYQFHIRANGVTRYGLTHMGIKSVCIPLPPLSEQASIVRYLDHVDRRIRRYVAAKKKLIALLEEERQAVVNQAVTRGLDPNVRLKPSGVEWLGDVPNHWKVCKLKQCGTISGGMTPSMEVARFWGGSIPWVTPKDMKQDVINSSSLQITDSALQETSIRLIDPPAVLVVVRGMILARRVPIAWTSASVTINQDMKALKVTKGTNAVFIACLLYSAQDALTPLIDQAGHGTRRLPTERWREVDIAMPPEHEQAEIVEYIDSKITKIASNIVRARRQIEIVQEYRTRLIADVVTGKFDVREAAALLPDEADDEEPMEEGGSLADSVAEGLYDPDESVEELAMEREVTV